MYKHDAVFELINSCFSIPARRTNPLSSLCWQGWTGVLGRARARYNTVALYYMNRRCICRSSSSEMMCVSACVNVCVLIRHGCLLRKALAAHLGRNREEVRGMLGKSERTGMEEGWWWDVDRMWMPGMRQNYGETPTASSTGGQPRVPEES